MKWRAKIRYLIVIMFCTAMFDYILTELQLLEQSQVPMKLRNEHPQGWDGKSKSTSEEDEDLPPADVPLDAVWQPVNGSRFRFYVYSAYVERRTVAAVRIIAVTKRQDADSVLCRLWLTDNRSFTLKAQVTAIREHWNLNYTASYVLCFLNGSGVRPHETVGASVAVVAANNLDNPPSNLLVVLDTEPKAGIQESLHICVKPFHDSFNRAKWLVEWFEINRLLGASHFYMYNGSLSATVACLLLDYRKQGLLTLLSWQLPFLSKIEIRTEGLFAAFNDCLYRSMSRTGWLLPIDVDEVVFPRRDRTLPALLKVLQAAYAPPFKAPSTFIFQNAFFYTNWEDDPEAKFPLVTALKTRRLSIPDKYRKRSKYALRPRRAVELGNHFVWELAPRARSVGVSNDRALLHHYRVTCEFDGDCLKAPSTIDRTSHRWTDDLRLRVIAQHTRVATACPI